MKKITISIFALMFFIANKANSQTINVDLVQDQSQYDTVQYYNERNQQNESGDYLNLDTQPQANYEREDVEYKEDRLNIENQNAREPENTLTRKKSLTTNGTVSRIRQQAKGVRERLLTTITRKNTLRDIRNAKLQNSESEESVKIKEENQRKLEEQKIELRRQQGKSDIPTVGESYRSVFNKLTEIQEKIEKSIPQIEGSKKINTEKVREDLENSRKSLSEANELITKLESVELNTNIDEESKKTILEAKKQLIESRKFLNNVLISLRQASKAKPIIQTSGSQVGQTGEDNDTDNDSKKIKNKFITKNIWTT